MDLLQMLSCKAVLTETRTYWTAMKCGIGEFIQKNDKQTNM